MKLTFLTKYHSLQYVFNVFRHPPN